MMTYKTKGYFVTGTDTHVGKTAVCRGLIRSFIRDGKRTLGVKPAASGAVVEAGQLQNEDGKVYQAENNIQLPYEVINPLCYEAPISPDIAARFENKADELTVATLQQKSQAWLEPKPDVLIVEGSGGWLCPLNEQESFADFASALGYPVIIVVDIKLGCINHTCLTYQSIKSSGLPIAGWIANHTAAENDPVDAENIKTLLPKLKDCPFLGRLKFNGPNQNLFDSIIQQL